MHMYNNIGVCVCVCLYLRLEKVQKVLKCAMLYVSWMLSIVAEIEQWVFGVDFNSAWETT